LGAAWEDFVLRFGSLGAVASGIAFAVALAGCSGNSSVTPPAPKQVNVVAATSASTINLTGSITGTFSGGFTVLIASGCGTDHSHLHIYTGSATMTGLKPATGLFATVSGTGACDVSVTATSVKVTQASQVPASSSVLWHVGDPAHAATDGQCGEATYPTATSADFVLVKDGGCMRNQLNPIGNGSTSVYFLNIGQTYTWTFQTVTHMGIDTGEYTQRLIWQIHQYNCGMSPNTVLGIENMTGGATGQRWYFLAGGKTFTMPYTEGATDNWQITAKIENASSGTEELYRNGVLIANTTGSNFTCGSSPFWNFGPYMWNWVGQGGGVSSLTRVEILFNSMQLTSQ
jgi:hypothetical protein